MVEGAYLPFVIAQIKDISLLPFAIPVLYNICLDYGMMLKATKNLQNEANNNRTCPTTGFCLIIDQRAH